MLGPKPRPLVRISRWTLRLTLTAAMGSAMALYVPIAVHAGGCTGSGRTPGSGPKPSNFSYFDGVDAQDNGSELGGVYSDIKDYSPYVNTGDAGAYSSQWVMLKQQAPCQWAQAGYKQFINGSAQSTRRSFVSYTASSNQTGCSPYTDQSGIVEIDYTLGDTEGSYHYFTVTYGSCTYDCTVAWGVYLNAFRFYHDGAQLGGDYNVNNVADGNWFVPDLAEIKAEISKFKEQMAGNGTDKEDFSSNHFWSGGSSGSWKTMGGDYWNPSYQSQYFGNTVNSDTDVQVWDKTATGCTS